MHHAQCIVISFRDVMAFSEPATADKHTVDAVGKGPEHEFQVDSAGAHQPNHPDTGRKLVAGNSAKVRPGITAPVAQEPQDFWFEFMHRSHSPVTPLAVIPVA